MAGAIFFSKTGDDAFAFRKILLSRACPITLHSGETASVLEKQPLGALSPLRPDDFRSKSRLTERG
jgi:hypothetical protein